MAEYVVEIKNITKRFPDAAALHNMRLAVKPGGIHGLIGENGAGKSTLIKTLTGVHMADEGDIYVNGEKMVFHNPNQSAAAGIAIVFVSHKLEELFELRDRVVVMRGGRVMATVDRDSKHFNQEDIMKAAWGGSLDD